MNTAFIFFLFATTAYVQCRPSEQPVEADGEVADAAQVEEKDFCKDVVQSDQLIFLGCLATLVPQANNLIQENGGDAESLLQKICGDNRTVYEAKIIAALETSDDAIETCSALIQSSTP
uniref:Putative secreted protein n=1 Tax=Amblyomma cajennense TaxID=34607 RepID=A0A023FBV6_AMBCJ